MDEKARERKDDTMNGQEEPERILAAIREALCEGDKPESEFPSLIHKMREALIKKEPDEMAFEKEAMRRECMRLTQWAFMEISFISGKPSLTSGEQAWIWCLSEIAGHNLPVIADYHVLEFQIEEFKRLMNLYLHHRGDIIDRRAKGWSRKRIYSLLFMQSFTNNMGALETQTAIKQVRLFIETHGASRFQDLHGENRQRIVNRAGFRQTVEGRLRYCFFSEVFKREVCAGLSVATVCKALLERGLLVAESARHTMRVRTPEGRMKCYAVSSTILDICLGETPCE